MCSSHITARSSSSRGRDILVQGARAGLVARLGLVAVPLRMDWVVKVFSRILCESEVEHPKKKKKKILNKRVRRESVFFKDAAPKEASNVPKDGLPLMHVQAALKNKTNPERMTHGGKSPSEDREEARSVDRRESGFDQNTLHVWNYQ